MHTPADRVRRASKSRIRIMYELAEAQPPEADLVRLEVGEPDFDTPEHVIDAAAEAARAGGTHYTPNAGTTACRAAVGQHMTEAFGVEYPTEEIVITVGGVEALQLTALSVVDAGEELLYPGPAWPNYETQAYLADGVPVEVPLRAEEGYDLDADRMIERMGPETALVILGSPSNPTGRVFEPEAVRAVIEAAGDHGAYVIADEVYAALTYDREPEGMAAYTDYPEHVLTVGSCSKTHAMTGWRIGWLAGTNEVTDEVVKIREATTSCPSEPGQHAAIEALTGPQEPFEAMYEAFAERRDYVVERIEGIEGLSAPKPQGAFYVFLEPDVDADDLAFAKYLLREHGVVLAPGSAFGEAGVGRLRLSFANSLERLEAGFDRIETGLRAFRGDRG
ncbi:pyridoxal phosphate-dependent aminotransferase [Salinirubellus sp. GCM10025818]|uniref:pyridoxal phosphate-dependent aminotransferase n=1 Tax=Salinirubellus TaxID=2162630 RepID=UPI0030D2293B